VAIPALAALIWLGVWQLQRAQWKADLTAQYEQAAKAPPQPLGVAICSFAKLNRAPTREELYRPIDGANVVAAALMSWPPAGARFRMFGQDANGNAGWRHLVVTDPPDCLADQGRILVEGPFEPFIPGQQPVVADAGPAPARYMAVEWPAKPVFAMANSPMDNDWHWFDAAAMASYLDVPKINDRFYLEIMPEELPAFLSRTPVATHYGYAATWFGMAIAFAVIYALFHARAGRLRFRKPE